MRCEIVDACDASPAPGDGLAVGSDVPRVSRYRHAQQLRGGLCQRIVRHHRERVETRARREGAHGHVEAVAGLIAIAATASTREWANEKI